MIKAVIVEDEPNNVIILEGMIQEFCPHVSIAGKAGNVHKAEALIRETDPDLVFMDIEMPYGSGFDVLDRLRPARFEVIFVTAFNEYTVKAFRYSALDYLLKPIDINELLQSVSRAERNIQLKNFDRRLDGFLQSMKKLSLEMPKIGLPGKNGVVFVNVSDIMRLEANRGYTHIIIKDKRKIISSKNILEYEELLPGNKFYRVHHSHLVNLSYVNGYQRGRGGYLEMEDGAVIEVAVRRKDELMVRLGLSHNV
ncbi:LytTR family DNA-binding domain-containing protein [Flavitalea sp. BT771]|uniref:LytR/AlgR family response regulator transcription factor n=1 Tax=Flavitalea sp. BT771 TaxID=3063329 RepID=UPI0026E25426|nr:LytTR family DNA-binding domain-containing protein [Flavitalea sp. BT771]MDO6431879.1 LytTR family DNA-binding domain-containing protein [Flavitalea sp. BT771]MDV6220788.1 LytTR family DNA-binding domain-containing protein [Flavitalea sp. BT771]